MLEGFVQRRVATRTPGVSINLKTAGSGPPLLMLHGYPQTHAMWHTVAPAFTKDFTVILPDLRGYGDSDKPAPLPGDSNYTKRAMGQDMVEVMEALGYPRFRLVGHDRGARVAYRLALDHPDRVEKLVILDIIPTVEHFERLDLSSAVGSFHMYMMAQPSPLPEKFIGADPEFWLRYAIDKWAAKKDFVDPAAMAEYVRCFVKPETIAATCSEYRVAVTTDREHDIADREAGRKIKCPMLTMWGASGRPYKAKGVMESWRRWAEDVTGEGADCGHFIPEEAPEATVRALAAFLP